MPATSQKPMSRQKSELLREAREAPIKNKPVEQGPKFSAGVAAVGVAAGALAGFLTPIPGAIAIGAALGGVLGKLGAEPFDDDCE